MKSIIYLIIALSIVSCNNRIDPLKLKNTTPKFTINGNDNNWNNNTEYLSVLNDSIKVFRDYKINYKIEEEEEALIKLKEKGKQGKSKYLNDNISDSIEILVGEGQIIYNPSVVGNHNIEYTVVDPYKNESTVKLNLVCFENLLPVSNFNIEYLGLNATYEYRVDARSSYDRDSKFGGGLLQYRLFVDNHIMHSPSGLFPYNFPRKGTYKIGVQVMDNDSIWGLKKEITFDVN